MSKELVNGTDSDMIWIVTIRSLQRNPVGPPFEVLWTTYFNAKKTPLEFLQSLRKDQEHSIICAFLQKRYRNLEKE